MRGALSRACEGEPAAASGGRSRQAGDVCCDKAAWALPRTVQHRHEHVVVIIEGSRPAARRPQANADLLAPALCIDACRIVAWEVASPSRLQAPAALLPAMRAVVSVLCVPCVLCLLRVRPLARTC